MKHLERLEEIDRKIAQARESSDIKDELQSHLEDVEQRRVELNEKINRLFAYVDAGKAKFENLESNSVVSLFYKVLGMQEALVEEEHQNFVQSALEYNAALDQLHLLDFEIKIVRRKLHDISKMQMNVDALLEEKQKIINVHDAATARKIGSYDNLIYSARKKERDGLKLIAELDKILKDLRFIYDIVNKTGDWMSENRGARNYLPFWYNKQIKLASRASSRVQNNLDEIGKHILKFDSEIQLKKMYVKDYLDRLFDQLIKDWVANYYFKSTEKNIKDTIAVLESLKIGIEEKLAFLKEDVELLIKEKREFLLKL